VSVTICAARFEEIDDEIRAELRCLQDKIAHLHALDEAVEAEREEGDSCI
jgi:hypothetical protein